MTQQQTIETKLESFEQANLAKAKAEREQILADTEQLKHNELEKEENRLLEELYQKIQKQIDSSILKAVGKLNHTLYKSGARKA